MAPDFSTLKTLLFLLVVIGLVQIITWSWTQAKSETERQEGDGERGQESASQLLADAEAIWKSSKLKRAAAVEQLGNAFLNDPWATHAVTVFWNFFTPTFHCPLPAERIGRVGDGGKWVCGFSSRVARRELCTVYSFGVGGEITFEEELLQRSNCTVRMYDYTIDTEHGPGPELVNRFPGRGFLYKLGLGSSNENDGRHLRTLRAEMDRNADEFIDILKVDIEGGEFAALDSMIEDFPSGQLPFGQLQVELHVPAALPPENTFYALLQWFERLEAAGLRAFHCEPNLIPNILNNINYIGYMEYSFLNVNVDGGYFY